MCIFGDKIQERIIWTAIAGAEATEDKRRSDKFSSVLPSAESDAEVTKLL